MPRPAGTTNAVKTALYAKLETDSTLRSYIGTQRVFDSVAPQETARPYVVFSLVAGNPSHSFAGWVFDNDLVLAKGLTDGFSSVMGGNIADRIDALLDDGTLSIGTRLLYMRREDDVSYVEPTAENVRINHIGAQYRLWVK